MGAVRPQAGREIELKFLCEPQDGLRALAAAPQGPEEPRELVSVYFDTPQGDLRKAGASLRVRESNGRRVQTLKRGEGLSREEYEVALVSGSPNLSAPPLVELLSEDQRRTLRPTFGVGVIRRERLVRHGGAEIEIALDRGQIRGGGRTAPISELELELKTGSSEALFDLARELSKAAPLYLSFDGKSSQGEALVSGALFQPRRKDKARLRPAATAGEAFQTIARNALVQIAANAAVLRRGESVEAVHQLRVATRRLRSALSVFKPVVEDVCHAAIGRELKWLGGVGNDARNLDVFLADIAWPATAADGPPEDLDALIAALERERIAAHAKVAEAMASPRFRALLLETSAWLETGPWLVDDGAAAWRLRHRSARAFAREVLEARLRKLLKKGRKLSSQADEARHEVRIEAKKLRYAVEGFAPLFSEKPVARFVGRLKTLQDELGALNDLATAQATIGGLGIPTRLAFVAGRLTGARAADREKTLRRADKALKRLSKAEPAWA